MLWSFGSVSGVSASQLKLFVPFVAGGLICALMLVKPLNLLLTGETYAQSTGMRLRRVRTAIIVSTGLLAGVVTAFCGPIGFVGTAVPHICRMLLHTSDHRLLMPACILSGAILVLLCDVIAHLPVYQGNLPLNAVTALFGAPVVIWILLDRRSARAFGTV
jgi:iron complex transport system permease protein